MSFLTNIATWRRSWLAPNISIAQLRHDQFIEAARIYVYFVSAFAEFPINLSSKEMKKLQELFEDAANLLYRHKRPINSSNFDSATPFDNVLPNEFKNSFSSTTELKSNVNPDVLSRADLRSVTRVRNSYTDNIAAGIQVHEAFKASVWDAAEREIKYLVLTNTWPKFVHFGHASSPMNKKSDEEEANAWVKKFWSSF